MTSPGREQRRSVEEVAADTVTGARPGALPHRARLERAFVGHDLSSIRVADTGGGADGRRRVQAHAFAYGEAVSLPADASPGLVAHEVVHVLQNRSGTVRDGAAAEAEAGRLSARAVGGHAVGHELAPARRGTGALVLHRAPNQAGTTDPSHVLDWVSAHEGDGSVVAVLNALSDAHAGNTDRYFYTDTYGWVDIRHFAAAARMAVSAGSVVAEGLGLGNEVVQWLSEWGDSYRSGFSPEDVPSNAAGGEFGDDFVGSVEGESLHDALQRWMTHAGARPASDAAAHRDALPATDPAERGGAARGSSNASRTQSTASGAAQASVDAAEQGFMSLFDWRNYARMYGLQVP
ncbi:eCIS core domain-containing protein [Cellulomonas terrae]|uniref:eCIS core domain-containing protein n=1 Tax=Cellulomonas terrae TaxID=311234 RepID=A0A511JHI3_9CELL|nr:DUF4157 domain-containing protein [Cellulomonas terrae]GEL97434.1 hypothetical protein CTE05_09810 [Cellulomonas terrae]